LRFSRDSEITRVRLLWVFFAYACFSLEIINGYQDGLLMVSTGMAALAFMEWGDRGAVWIVPLAAGLSLIKTEGAVLSLILVLLLVCFQVVAMADGAWGSSG
jgi:hypothetical protein